MKTISNLSETEKLGKRRFKSGIEFEKQVRDLTATIQTRLLSVLPSNYPKNNSTNLGLMYKAIAHELALLQTSLSDIIEDQYHNTTRIEYIYQILGDLLFLGEKSINENLADTEYRDFLIKVRNAYFVGSTKDNIEASVSDILGLPVVLRELYLELRNPNTSYTLKDTNKMFFDILMDSVSSSSNIGNMLEDIRFFINLIKPAHTLYDTRLIYTEVFENNDGACESVYDDVPVTEDIYDTDRMYVVTYLTTKLSQLEIASVLPTGGVIASIDRTNRVIVLTDNRIIVYRISTTIVHRDLSDVETTISADDLDAGDFLEFIGTADSSTTSSIIDTDWLYNGVISDIDETTELITLVDGSILVYNDDTLVYTRDGAGEHRIEIADMEIGQTIIFRAKKYTDEFQFYNVPTQVQSNYYKQFDRTVTERPFFQENVKKVFETRDDLEEGYHVIVEDGIAKVIRVDGRFYKQLNKKTYKNVKITRYSLFIDNTYQATLSYEEPNNIQGLDEIKNTFAEDYGFTGLNVPSTDYQIKVYHTGELKESATNSVLQTSYDDTTHLCDRRAGCYLLPMYEDTRKYWTWPDLQLVSGFFNSVDLIYIPPDISGHSVPGYFRISDDPNSYSVPTLPMFGPSGELATASDLIVYINGLEVENAVDSVDPWTGIIFLNFLPPSNSKIRVDYYYSKRYPDPVDYLVYDQNGLKSYYIDGSGNKVFKTTGDVGASFSIMQGLTGPSPRLKWPFPVNDPMLLGDDTDYQMNLFPILNRTGQLAYPDDISVSVGSVVSANQVSTAIGLDVVGMPNIPVGITGGDTIVIDATNYLDNTLIYSVVGLTGIAGLTGTEGMTGDIGLVIDSPFSVASPTIFDSTVIRYQGVTGAVESVRPLLGHVKINFLPPAGSVLKFEYYYTHYERKYRFQTDYTNDYSKTLDPGWYYQDSGSLPDVSYGPRFGYSLVLDYGVTGMRDPVIDFEMLKKIGYRYRAFNLSHSAVLNSSDTLENDTYDKSSVRASFGTGSNTLDHYNLTFSPEYLTDTDPNVVLNDNYLKKDIPAATQLYPGTPPFVKTFTDDGHAKLFILPEGEDTYEEADLVHQDLKAGFTIIDADESGLIDQNKVCAYPINQKINLYSDLKMEEFSNGGFDAPISTIAEGSRTIPFKMLMIDQYYPNREMRVNDYLDYINRVPFDIQEGQAKTLNGSKTIKSIDKNWLVLHVGDQITLKNVPIRNWNTTLHEYETTLEDVIYTIVEVIDSATVRLHTSFKEVSGTYDYSITRHVVFNVDTYLNKVTRNIVFKASNPFTYGFPQSYLEHFPGYSTGDTGFGFQMTFPDSDPDPYPRNPDNPNINGFPAGPQLLSSEVIKENGESIYYNITGYSGFTGPSGAVDLGITGPTNETNPTIVDGDDIYFIPGGETGYFLSYSEAEYRVQWRNWDQDIMILSFGSLTGPNAGVIVEDPINMLDDYAEGLRRSYWSVSTYNSGSVTGLVHNFYFGAVIETSKNEGTTVNAVDYPEGLIVLTDSEAVEIEDLLNQSIDPTTVVPNLKNTQYALRTRIVRELLFDNTVKVTEIREFERP